MSAKIIGASSAGMLAGVAALQAIPGPKRPESFWPITFTGWVSLVASVGALVAMGYALHRFSQKGIIEKLDTLDKHHERRETETERKIDEKIDTIRKHYDAQILDMRHYNESQMNAMSLALKGRMDGFGERVGDNEDAFAALSTIVSGLATSNAESRMDRQHINGKLDRIEGQLEVERNGRSAFEHEIIRMLGDIRRSITS